MALDSEPFNNGSEGDGQRGPTDSGQQQTNLDQLRLRGQVEILLRSLPDAVIHPADRIENTEFVYRKDRILVRDGDLDRVRAVLGGEVADPLINGVTSVALEGIETLAAVARIDTALGSGIATPDHAMWIAPARMCPATEPEPVNTKLPLPAVRRDARGEGVGTLVSVVDTGLISALVSSQHPWLTGVSGDEESFDAANIGDYVGHGTFVAGTLRCIAPAAEIFVEGVLINGGAVYESEIIKQLNDAMDKMPDIISMSAGCTTRGHLPPLAFQAFWEYRLQHCKGTVLVAAAGNDGSRQAFWPAAFEWAVSVGALEPDGTRAPYSNFGSWVDVYAVGTDLVNAYPNGTYHYTEPPKTGQTATFTNEMASWSGTSFATPIVAGMIAARMSHTGQSGRRAADSILRIARKHGIGGIGAIADPSMALDLDPFDT